MPKDLSRGDVPTLILAVLAHGPAHGYAIARAIEQHSANALQLREGTLYPTLRLLEQQDYISSAWELQEQGPARRVYTLTTPGRIELEQRIAAWERYSTAMTAVLGLGRMSHG
jgi:PadR family transcriptional regulator PadR